MKQRLPWLIGLAVLGTGIAIYFLKPEPSKLANSVYVEETKRRSGACPGSRGSVSSEGNTYTLTANWFECNAIKKGDLVWYRYAFDKPPVARRVVAAEGDEFSVEKTKDARGWNLFVNKRPVFDSHKEPIWFGNPAHEPPLKLYTKDGVGTLAKRQAIVFSEKSPGSFDSGIFGVVNADDFLGKVENMTAPAIEAKAASPDLKSERKKTEDSHP